MWILFLLFWSGTLKVPCTKLHYVVPINYSASSTCFLQNAGIWVFLIAEKMIKMPTKCSYGENWIKMKIMTIPFSLYYYHFHSLTNEWTFHTQNTLQLWQKCGIPQYFFGFFLNFSYRKAAANITYQT